MTTRNAQGVAEGHAGYLVLHEHCDVCGHRQVTVAPVGVPLRGLECARCHQLAARAVVVVVGVR